MIAPSKKRLLAPKSRVPSLFSLKVTKLYSKGSGAAVLKRQIKKQLNSQGNNQNLLMNYLIFPSQKDTILEIWRGWQKEYIRQVIIWQLQTQHILGFLCAKHDHYLLGVDNKIGELFRWKHMAEGLSKYIHVHLAMK